VPLWKLKYLFLQWFRAAPKCDHFLIESDWRTKEMNVNVNVNVYVHNMCMCLCVACCGAEFDKPQQMFVGIIL
jgi:hypothetical protein